MLSSSRSRLPLMRRSCSSLRLAQRSLTLSLNWLQLASMRFQYMVLVLPRAVSVQASLQLSADADDGTKHADRWHARHRNKNARRRNKNARRRNKIAD